MSPDAKLESELCIASPMARTAAAIMAAKRGDLNSNFFQSSQNHEGHQSNISRIGSKLDW